MTDQPRTLRQYLDLGENLLASDLPPRERAILEQRLIDMKTLVEKIEAKQPSWPEMLQVIIPYIDTVCTLRTAVAVGAFQKANMRGIQARRAATAHKETDARATAMRVNIALAIYPFGRNKLYQLMARGELPYRKIDGATLLPTAALEALVTPKG